MRFYSIVFGIALALHAQEPAPQPQAAPRAPKFSAGANLVVLDLVVRDKKGRPVKDIAPGDIDVYDDGKRVTFQDLHLVEAGRGGDAALVGTTATTSAGGQPPAMDPLRQLRLVTLVFERLGVDGRVLARQAALDLLKQPQRTNVYYAVFVIDQRLKLLQQYTNDRQALRRAIEHATTGAYTDFTSESDQLQAQLQNQVGGPDGTSLGEQVAAIQGGGVMGALNQSQPGGLANAAMAQMQLDMLQFSQQLAREQVGRASIYSLLALVRGQTELPGRKSVLYFTEGLYVPTSMAELFQTVISAANRNNVTFYAADIRGLRTTAEGGSSELRSAAGAATKSSRHDPRSPAPVTRDEATAQDRAAESIRMNGQNAMAELAEDTGGFLISNTNDFRLPLRRVEEELNSYYELHYQPENVEYDGKFHRIEVRALRTGLVIQARSGYFALPPSAGAAGGPVLLPFEVPLLKVLGGGSLPHDLEFRSLAVPMHTSAGEVESALVVEIPLAKIQFQHDDRSQTYRGEVGVLALVRDAKGIVVKKIARDLPFEAPPDKLEKLRNGNFVLTDEFSVPPGRYTLETAVLDRKAEKAAARKSVFLAPSSSGKLSVSALLRVQDFAPGASGLEPEDPFQFHGGRITPTLDEMLYKGETQTLGLFCVISPDPQEPAKPALTLEYVQEDKIVGRGDFELPVPDSRGRIQWALFTPIAELKPGPYEVRVIIRQGRSAVSEQMLLEVEM